MMLSRVMKIKNKLNKVWVSLFCLTVAKRERGTVCLFFFVFD